MDDFVVPNIMLAIYAFFFLAFITACALGYDGRKR